MTRAMRNSGYLLLGLVACGDSATQADDPNGARTFPFGPITVEAHSEDLTNCVSLTIENTEEVFVSEVELATGPGFHHSNWLWVPDHAFPGPDGVFKCDDRTYDQTAAGILGGVFFAQSTQSEREVQAFPAGVALKLPVKSKLVAQLHLLNNSDEPVSVTPTIGYKVIPPEQVMAKLANVTFEYHPLGLPPRKQSRFTVECDLAERHQQLFGRDPDFKIYYALAHYHEYATRMLIEAVRADGTAATIYTTESAVGDTLGGPIEPAFDMTGFAKLRLSCDYYNSTDGTIYYGNGNGEMCIFNAFSDSPFVWAGGALDTGSPGTGTEVDGVMSFTRNCQVYAVENEKF